MKSKTDEFDSISAKTAENGDDRTTDDAISRRAVIGALDMIGSVDTDADREYARKVFMSLPSVQPQRWISVTEALPDRGKTVLITNDKGNVRSGRFRGVEFWKDDGIAYWTFKGNTVEHVLAWMPLPEPYEPQESEVKK